MTLRSKNKSLKANFHGCGFANAWDTGAWTENVWPQLKVCHRSVAGHRASYVCANYTNEYLFNYRVKPQPATGQRNEDRGRPRSDMDNSLLAPTWPCFLSLCICRIVL